MSLLSAQTSEARAQPHSNIPVAGRNLISSFLCHFFNDLIYAMALKSALEWHSSLSLAVAFHVPLLNCCYFGLLLSPTPLPKDLYKQIQQTQEIKPKQQKVSQGFHQSIHKDYLLNIQLLQTSNSAFPPEGNKNGLLPCLQQFSHIERPFNFRQQVELYQAMKGTYARPLFLAQCCHSFQFLCWIFKGCNLICLS